MTIRVELGDLDGEDDIEVVRDMVRNLIEERTALEADDSGARSILKWSFVASRLSQRDIHAISYNQARSLIEEADGVAKEVVLLTSSLGKLRPDGAK